MLNEHDVFVLKKILHYCDNIEEAMQKYNIDEDVLPQNEFLSAMCGMFVQQIGELAKHLTDEFIEKYPGQRWKEIKGMRDIYAHEYENVNAEMVWKTISEDVPNLKKYCEKVLSEN